MNKTLLKLATVGAAITMLLGLLIVTQGCKANPQGHNTTILTTEGTGSGTSGTQALPPDNEYDTFDTTESGADNGDTSEPTDSGLDVDVPVEDTPSHGTTDPQINNPGVQDTQPGSSNTQPNEQPTQPATEPKYTLSLKEYEAMSPDQQLAYMNSFPKIEDYIAWLTWAKAEDSDNGIHVEIGENGSVDIGDIDPQG